MMELTDVNSHGTNSEMYALRSRYDIVLLDQREHM